MKKFVILSLLSLLFLLPQIASAKITVHGTVLSSKTKAPIVGALIKEKNSDSYTSTDVDGNFTLNVDEGTQLEITSIGYKAKTLKVKSDAINVFLSPDKDLDRTPFVTITGGLVSVAHNFSDNMDFGIMGGAYFTNWGFYGRLSFPIALSTPQRVRRMGVVASLGAIRNITNNFRIFAGTGFGVCLSGYQTDGYWYGDGHTFTWAQLSDGGDSYGVPFELGVQYNIKHLNLMAGIQYVMNVSRPQDYYYANLKPFLGIGYTFR